ncbi:urea amidolyase associated protein UAAP1 [Halotalea alkalilenta]|uniref:urea amidolyase associated protein UAAP1 n=1 Tax=Halotalea alkalilenta TaxID=376489 RepID=UPI0004882112|nr:urea amidolyase associated protein UAAP1 [Halotalea alkalilenta]
MNLVPDVDYRTRLPGGQHWSLRLRRGTSLTLIAEEPGCNVGLLLYSAEQPLERLNLPDTLKCQHTFHLGRGHCLYSDMGRVLASIVEDDCGGHDAVGGNLGPGHFEAKGWRRIRYQQGRNERTQSGHESFLIELAKYGLGLADLSANLNLFSKLTVDEQGRLRYLPDHCAAGDRVTLRFELDVLVMLHTCPHPLDPSPDYPHRGVTIELGTLPPPDRTDVCLSHCAENARGFDNNRLYLLGQ